MAEVAAEEWGVAPGDVEFAEGRVTGGGNRAMEFGELAKLSYMKRVSLSATGFYKTPDIHWDRATMRGKPFFYFSYGAAVVEVAVDTLTGEHRCLSAHLVQDCGRSLNPSVDIGQVEGAFVQGMGWLTCEELWWDGEGRLRTLGPATYKIPGSRDVPPVLRHPAAGGCAGPVGDDLPFQGGGRAAADAGDRGVERAEGCDRHGSAGRAGDAGTRADGDPRRVAARRLHAAASRGPPRMPGWCQAGGRTTNEDDAPGRAGGPRHARHRAGAGRLPQPRRPADRPL